MTLAICHAKFASLQSFDKMVLNFQHLLLYFIGQFTHVSGGWYTQMLQPVRANITFRVQLLSLHSSADLPASHQTFRSGFVTICVLNI